MSELSIIYDENGEQRRMGALPRMMSRCGDGLIPTFGDEYLVDEAAWPVRSAAAGAIVRRLAVESPDIDQKHQGSCTYSALLHCIMQRIREAGRAPTLLAQSTGYAWDGVASSGELIPRRSDSGMALDVAILISRMVGGVPANIIDPLDYKRTNWPDDWKIHGYQNSVDEWRDCSAGMKYIVSNLCNSIPLLHGYAQHARMLIEFDSPNNRFGFKNTYGSKWNEDGFGWLSWKQVDQGRRQYGAFAPITIRDPLGDGDAPTR